MSNMVGFLIALTTVLVFILVRRWYKRGEGLPPGAANLPLIGCVPWFVNRRLYKYATDLEKELGRPGLVSFRIFNKIFIIVNNDELAQKVFIQQSDITSERPKFPMNEVTNPFRLGIVGAPRERWEYARRFSLRVLRDFGLGKSKVIDGLIADEIVRLEKKFDSKSGTPFDPDIILRRGVAGIIGTLLFGLVPQEDDDAFDMYLEDMGRFLSTPFRSVLFFPFLRKFFRVPILSRLVPEHDAIDGFDRVMAFLTTKIKEHRSRLEEIHEPRNFIDAYLLSKENPSSVSTDSTVQEHGDDHLRLILFELFVAGSDTTSVTLKWGLLFLGYYQDIQERMFQEIDERLGREVPISYSHMSQLNYTKAVVNEVLRFGCVAGLSLPHTATRDIFLRGYRIPKDCVLFLNIFNLLHLESQWKNPNQFDPQNFLDDEGNFAPNDHFVGFSIGRRACLGESLARNEVFVFLTSIIQKFRISLHLEEGQTYDSLLVGVTMAGLRSPSPFKITVRRRVDE